MVSNVGFKFGRDLSHFWRDVSNYKWDESLKEIQERKNWDLATRESLKREIGILRDLLKGVIGHNKIATKIEELIKEASELPKGEVDTILNVKVRKYIKKLRNQEEGLNGLLMELTIEVKR